MNELTETTKVCIMLDLCMREHARLEQAYNEALTRAADASHMDARFDADGKVGCWGVSGNGDTSVERETAYYKVRALQFAAEQLSTARLRLVVAQRDFAAAFAK